MAGSQVKGLESKFYKVYFIHMIPTLSSFPAIYLKGHFRKRLARIFKFVCFSCFLGTKYTFSLYMYVHLHMFDCICTFDNMADNTDMLYDEEHITKLIKKVFEDEFKKQKQILAKIISGNLEITMQEIKSFENEINELKKSMEFTQNDLEERVNNVEENMCKVKKT